MHKYFNYLYTAVEICPADLVPSFFHYNVFETTNQSLIYELRLIYHVG